MQWDDSPGRGFTAGEPWLPFGPREPNVAHQDGDPDSMLALYRRATRVRRKERVLREGTYGELLIRDGLWVYERALDGEPSVVVAINTSLAAVRWTPPRPGPVILASDRRLETDGPVDIVELPPLGAAAVRLSGA
jgi:alpha-glucosidase